MKVDLNDPVAFHARITLMEAVDAFLPPVGDYVGGVDWWITVTSETNWGKDPEYA